MSIVGKKSEIKTSKQNSVMPIIKNKRHVLVGFSPKIKGGAILGIYYGIYDIKRLKEEAHDHFNRYRKGS